jgi:hypothetical protein
MREAGVTPEQAVYVGDSLMKDVAMAKHAGVLDAWAKYGVAQQHPEYDLLRRVTHWTASAVQKEKDLKEEEVLPTLVLETGLGDLLDLCQFKAFRSEPNEREKLVVDIWSKTVDVQQHFNDLELRIRNYAVTLLVAIVGASAFAVKENLRLAVAGLDISVAATLLTAGAFAWLAFYLMDRFWYHRLLYGAVKHAVSIEKRWEKELPELRLTGSIGDESPVTVFGKKLRSSRKIDLFYAIVFGLTLIMASTVQWGTSGRSRIVAQPAPTATQAPIPTPRPTIAPAAPTTRTTTAGSVP